MSWDFKKGVIIDQLIVGKVEVFSIVWISNFLLASH